MINEKDTIILEKRAGKETTSFLKKKSKSQSSHAQFCYNYNIAKFKLNCDFYHRRRHIITF